MDHGHSETSTATPPLDTPREAVKRGMAVASISLGYFSMVVFFWHPFSTVLASVGLILATISLLRGVRGGLFGERLTLVGFAICSFSLTVVLTLNQGLRFVQWEH